MTNQEKLQEYIKQSGLKRGFIAERLGITPYGLSMKITNKSEFKASEIDILCEILHIDVTERMAIFFAKSVDCQSTQH